MKIFIEYHFWMYAVVLKKDDWLIVWKSFAIFFIIDYWKQKKTVKQRACVFSNNKSVKTCILCEQVKI